MTDYVIDASVVIKWFVPEVHSSDADLLLSPGYHLYGPDLLYAETGNILWKKVRRGEISSQDGELILSRILASPIHIQPAQPLLSAAYHIALETGATVYDSIYVALAMTSRCEMITTDQKLFRMLQAQPFLEHARWIEEIGS